MIPDWFKLEEVQDFILQHQEEDLAKLRLSGKFPDSAPALPLTQILEFRKRLAQKFPEVKNLPSIYIPSQKSVEQASSMHTASYKVENFPADTLAEITGGLGLDLLARKGKLKKGYYFDIDPELVEAFEWNSKIFDLPAEAEQGDGNQKFLEKNIKVDLVYIDPSRRVGGKRVSGFEDMEPNVLPHIDYLLKASKSVLIKAAPMLDLAEGVRTLPQLKEIHVLSKSDECKEVLFYLKSEKTSEEIKLVHAHFIHDEWRQYACPYSDIIAEQTPLGELKDFLYLPWPSIRKSGAYRNFGKQFNLVKPESNTHVFFSDKLEKGFPGRVFKIKNTYKSLKEIKGKFKKAEILIRNHENDLGTLRKKAKIQAGNENTLLVMGRKSDLKILELERL